MRRTAPGGQGGVNTTRLEQQVEALRDVPCLRTVETARGRVGIVHYHSQ